MTLVFIQLRCKPGRTYEVADAIYDREFASELYSTSGDYDLLLKVYIPEGADVGPLCQREDPRHPAHRPQPDDADLQGVLSVIADWDDAYANAPHIPGGDDYPPRWEALARDFRAGDGRAAARGPAVRGAPAAAARPVPAGGRAEGLVVFVHGGYWRAFDRGTWSHLAAGPLAHGWAVAMPGYVLAPEARIAAITAMIAEAVAAAAAEVAGADPARRAFGRRAPRGAAGLRRQPAAGRRSRRGVDRVVHDQRAARPAPAAAARLNDDACGSTPARPRPRARRCGAPRGGLLVHAWVGDGERPEFVRQTTLIANIWTGLGAEMEQTIEPRRHHFNVIDGLTHPGSGLVEAIVG